MIGGKISISLSDYLVITTKGVCFMNNKYFNDITIEQFHYFDQYPAAALQNDR